MSGCFADVVFVVTTCFVNKMVTAAIWVANGSPEAQQVAKFLGPPGWHT